MTQSKIFSRIWMTIFGSCITGKLLVINKTEKCHYWMFWSIHVLVGIIVQYWCCTLLTPSYLENFLTLSEWDTRYFWASEPQTCFYSGASAWSWRSNPFGHKPPLMQNIQIINKKGLKNTNNTIVKCVHLPKIHVERLTWWHI